MKTERNVIDNIHAAALSRHIHDALKHNERIFAITNDEDTANLVVETMTGKKFEVVLKEVG